jgi:hypothetical protein
MNPSGVLMEGGVLPKAKRVKYEGSDTLKPGYILCYNSDYGTASASDEDRMYRVEKPSSSNMDRIAGIVSQGTGTRVGPCVCEIYELSPSMSLLPVYTDQDCTQDSTTLFAQPGSYMAKSNGAKYIGKAAQTVDRSSTNGTVQAFLSIPAGESVVTASSRASTALPTSAIWSNFPIEDMRTNPFLGSLLDTDFRGAMPWANTFVDATYAASAGGKTPTEHIFIGDEAVGNLDLFITTDNQAAEMQFPCPVISSGTGIWAFEVRFKASQIANTKAGFFFGLMAPQKLTGDLIANGGALADVGAIGFQCKEADGDIIDVVYDKASQTQNEHSADWHTLVADTYVTAGLYYNGTTIAMYKNGSTSGTAISAVDIAAADFPAADVLVPTIAIKGAAGDDVTISTDWIRSAWIA